MCAYVTQAILKMDIWNGNMAQMLLPQENKCTMYSVQYISHSYPDIESRYSLKYHDILQAELAHTQKYASMMFISLNLIKTGKKFPSVFDCYYYCYCLIRIFSRRVYWTRPQTYICSWWTFEEERLSVTVVTVGKHHSHGNADANPCQRLFFSSFSIWKH